jgi:hypothetical protein
MNKGTKIAVGVGALAVAGFLYINSKKKKVDQQAVVANVKTGFEPVEIQPLELSPVAVIPVVKSQTKDQIFQSVLNTIYPKQTTALPRTIALSLNRNLILKTGSKGAEVRELQRLLGFTGKGIDGIFGKNTLASLKAKKQVSQITLNKF